jgi:RNA polymerase sigma-70 factor (ECF subfamily)
LNNNNHTLLTLVKSARNGALPAQEALYYQYCKAMYNLCIRMCGNETDAHDLLQEGFITAFEKLHQLKDAETFGGWLKRIMINQCIAHSKRKNIFGNLLVAENETAEEAVENRWDAISMEELHYAIKQLPEGCRQIFVLYAIEDYTHQQIASELGLSTGTSKSQYNRAKRLLQHILLKKLASNG